MLKCFVKGKMMGNSVHEADGTGAAPRSQRALSSNDQDDSGVIARLLGKMERWLAFHDNESGRAHLLPSSAVLFLSVECEAKPWVFLAWQVTFKAATIWMVSGQKNLVSSVLVGRPWHCR